MGKRDQEPTHDDDLIIPMPLGAHDRVMDTAARAYDGDVAQGSARMYLKVAEERAGQLRTALEMAATVAAGDVVTASRVGIIQELHRDAHVIEQRITRLRG